MHNTVKNLIYIEDLIKSKVNDLNNNKLQESRKQQSIQIYKKKTISKLKKEAPTNNTTYTDSVLVQTNSTEKKPKIKNIMEWY